MRVSQAKKGLSFYLMRHVCWLLCALAWGQDQPAPKPPPAWRISSRQFIAPPGATAPVLVKGQYSSALQLGTGHAVSVLFEIDEHGVPFNIRVEHSTDAESEDEVIALLREWRFEAAMKNGFPVAARGFLDLSLGDLAEQAELPPGARPKIKPFQPKP